MRCWGTFQIGVYRERLASCNCVAHTFGRAWSTVTAGESYIVHATSVGGAAGAAAYLGKYMLKAFDTVDAARLGMKRRFSKSNGWPSEPRKRLLHSVLGPGWVRRRWTAGLWEADAELREALSKEAAELLLTKGQARRDEKRAARALLKMIEGGR